jgi:hypothetical protein
MGNGECGMWRGGKVNGLYEEERWRFQNKLEIDYHQKKSKLSKFFPS